MKNDKFNAFSRGLRGILANKKPGTINGAGRDACAIHGRPGAQVALLQSLILPAARLLYIRKNKFRKFPFDKPHTCHPRLKIRFQKENRR